MNVGKIVLMVCMLLAGLSTARAGSVTLYQNSYSYSDGGEFTAVTSPNSFLGNYASTALLNVGQQRGFETFCVQSSVYFSPGTTYSYKLTDQATTGPKLTLGAAFLYDEFATGKLFGYDYTDTSIRKADNGELQLAIWAFQGQATPSEFSIPNGFSLSSDPFYKLAIKDLGGTFSAADAPNNGTYGVDIIQLYNGTTPAQAQLVLVSPEPPTILLLVFAGFLMVLFNRRKMLRGLRT